MLQELLTYAIEVVVVVGFGAIVVDHIIQNGISARVPQSTSQPASAPVTSAETLPLEPISLLEPQEKPQPEQPCIADPWELPILTSSRRWSTRQPIKPVLALCPAVENVVVCEDKKVSNLQENNTTSLTDLRTLDSAKLRKLCTQKGIVWRNVRGKGKHLTKLMMIEQLEELTTVA
jgi:hypothetical protein